MSKKAPLSLEGNLERLSGKLLKNTHMIPKQLHEKVRLIGDVYGRARVIEDFELWCGERSCDSVGKYPIIDYIQEVDSRLGGAEKQERANPNDPRVAQVQAAVYEKIGIVPPKQPIAKLILDYSPEEIVDAFDEYIMTLQAEDYERGVKKFFTDGGAAIVIFVRRKQGRT